MRYGLKESHIRKIQSVFANYSAINRVMLYGSRAKGSYQNSSDIDLSVYHLIENQDLTDHINRVGTVFYEKVKSE